MHTGDEGASAFLDRRQQIGKDAERDRVERAEGDRLDTGARLLPAFIPNPVDFAHQFAAGLKKRLTGAGQPDRIGAAVDQFRADPVLQCPDAAAKGWLGDMAGGGRGGEIPDRGEFHEVFEPVQFHCAPSCNFCIT